MVGYPKSLKRLMLNSRLVAATKEIMKDKLWKD